MSGDEIDRRGTEPAPPPPLPVSASELAAAARGYVLLFWGVALGLLLFFQAVRVTVIDLTRIPSYLAGCVVLLIGVGVLRLRAPRALRPPARLWVAGALPVYLAPFVVWWNGAPHVGYFLAHVLALAAGTTWLLWELTRLAGRAGQFLGQPRFYREAHFWAWIIVLLAGLPLAAATILTSLAAARSGNSLYAEWFQVIYAGPRWFQAVAMLPFTVAMACLWRARLLCLNLLHERREIAEAEGPGRSDE